MTVKGFKSFAEKTSLEFPEGITAIVGPNGSGKSNITEAIRWALGEQSAKSLRGGKMHDVIFSGTATRKPLNIAEVTLEFDNSDHFLPLDQNVVSVTRRLFLNGESEYFLNSKITRLKDIVDLFTDSGLGKNSFSIISQGQVEEVFNSKPEERRVIFEEAAGVLKYKKRKNQAETKLEETTDNLDRIQDILNELGKQLRPLKQQKETAEKFKSLQKEFVSLDIDVTVHEINRLRAEWEQSKQKLIEISQELTEQNQTFEKEREKTQSVLFKESEIESEIEKLQNNILELTRLEEKLTGEKNVWNERYKFTDENRQKAILLKRKLEEDLQKFKEEDTQETKKLLNLEKEWETTKSVIEELQNEISFLKKDPNLQIEKIRSEYIEKMQETSSLKNEMSYTEKNLSRVEYQLLKKIESFKKNEILLADAVSSQESELKELDRVRSHLEDCLQDFQKIKIDYETLRKQKNQFEKDYRSTKDAYDRLLFQIRHLENWRKNYAGLYAGVRSVLQNKDDLKGIIGVVAELVDVEKKYEAAIETALGSAGQFVAVQTEKDASQAIYYLRNHKKGRATFLPLSTVQPRKVPYTIVKQFENMPGYLGMAFELVSYEEALSPIIKHLLGTTLVTTTIEDALVIAKKIDFRYKIVSLEGDTVNAGGSLTGGMKQSQNQSLLTVKNDIENLERQRKNIKAKRDALKTSLAQLTQLSAQQEKKMEQMRKNGEEIRSQEYKLQTKQEMKNEKIQQYKKEVHAIEFERQALEKEKQTLCNQKLAISTKLKATEQEMKEYERKLTNENKMKHNQNEKLLQKETELEQVREKANTFQEKVIISTQKSSMFREQIERKEKELSQIKKEIQITSKKEVMEETEKITKKIQKISHSIQFHNQSMQEKILLKDELKKEVKLNERIVEHLHQKKEQLLTKKSEQSSQISRLEVTLDHLLDHLNGQYKLTYEEATIKATPPASLEESKQRLTHLKEQINQLGPVNLQAIEEYKEIFLRYENLDAQKEDLTEAKQHLMDTMKEMDEEVKRRFKKTFTQIQEKFSEIFPKMFGGGQALLSLTDPGNYLDAGVEMSAQPPGKKLQHLSLLSGGERSLTAIALLFAIIQVRPVPFCILDEAEAALDDANIARFGNFLRSFNGEPQFIIITHRKGTMEKADTLYGVTMQEKGVSKLISVKLNEMEKKSPISSK